jgi:hypothetical protein
MTFSISLRSTCLELSSSYILKAHRNFSSGVLKRLQCCGAVSFLCGSGAANEKGCSSGSCSESFPGAYIVKTQKIYTFLCGSGSCKENDASACCSTTLIDYFLFLIICKQIKLYINKHTGERVCSKFRRKSAHTELRQPLWVYRNWSVDLIHTFTRCFANCDECCANTGTLR